MPDTRPSETTKRMVLAACGNQCAHPDCDALVFELEDETIVGEIAHIKGRKPDTARYDPSQTEKERNSFSNLFALCGKHHKIIDNKIIESKYPADLLYKWKKEHEENVASIQDRNWIGFPASAVWMEPDGTSISVHYWADRNGRPRIYTKEQLAICNTLTDLFFLFNSINDILKIIEDQVNHESHITWLKQQVKKLKLNEDGFMDTVYEKFHLAQDIKFGEYILVGAVDARIKKEEIATRGRIALQKKTDSLPENPSFKK